MDHLASLTSLSHFLPIIPKGQPFFIFPRIPSIRLGSLSQFEYIVPSVDIHMYIRPIVSPQHDLGTAAVTASGCTMSRHTYGDAFRF